MAGALKGQQIQQDLDEEVENKMLIVHDIKPPFLSASQKFTKQKEQISLVKDPTSDFVKIAKQGSQALKTLRETQDRARMREKFWELAGSKMGDLLKVQK